KITKSLAKIKLGKQSVLELGNLDAKRDWGHSIDYVNAMWLMLQQEKPDDFVIATGETRTVRDFVKEACKYLNININFQGTGVNEVGIDDNGNVIVRVNPKFYRPAEVELLIGSP